MDCSTPGFPVLHYLPEFGQTHVHWVSDACLTISSFVASFSFCLQPLLALGSFSMSQLFTSGGQSIGTSGSVLPMNIQGWFPLGLTGWISLQSKGLSRVSNITVQKHQFFASGGQNIVAPASVPPMNIQDWFPLGLTGWISLQSKEVCTFFKTQYYCTLVD